MSIINPNSINGGFPVFGQDNPTQGFRDNFTNIRNNFVAAKAELEDIQGKVLVKSALLGGVVDNDLDGVVLSNAQLKAYTQTFLNLGQQFSDVTINFEDGNFQFMETGSDITLTIENWPTDTTTAAAYATLRLWFQVSSTEGTPHTITFPAAVNINSFNIKGLDDETKTITFPEGGNYIFDLSTVNGGTNIFISEVSRNRVDAELETKIDLLNANVTAANSHIGIIDANVGVMYLGNISTQANLGAYQTYANTSMTIINANVSAANAAIRILDANIGRIVGGATTALDTLLELGNALGNSDSFSSTVVNWFGNITANVRTLDANVGVLHLGNVSTQANLGAFQTYANTGLVTVRANAETVNAGNLNVTGVANIAPISEKFVANTSPAFLANVSVDFAQTAIVYVTSPSGNFSANVQNFNIPSGTISCVTVWISQGGTPYIANVIQINSSVRTINWQGGITPPPGNANKQDVISFTILNNGGTYTVLGQLATFG